ALGLRRDLRNGDWDRLGPCGQFRPSSAAPLGIAVVSSGRICRDRFNAAIAVCSLAQPHSSRSSSNIVAAPRRRCYCRQPDLSPSLSARLSLCEVRGGVMSGRTLEERVTALENTVPSLQKLPGELTPLRHEVGVFRQEFDSFRVEVNTRFDAIDRRVTLESDQLYARMRLLHEQLVTQIKILGEG